MNDYFCWAEGLFPLSHWILLFAHYWRSFRSYENLKPKLAVQIEGDSDNQYLDISYVISRDPFVVCVIARQGHILFIVAEAMSGGKDPELVNKDPATLGSALSEDDESVPIPEM